MFANWIVTQVLTSLAFHIISNSHLRLFARVPRKRYIITTVRVPSVRVANLYSAKQHQRSASQRDCLLFLYVRPPQQANYRSHH